MIPTISLKPGAAFPILRPAGFRILGAVDHVSQQLAISLIITSGSESRGRSPTDPHMTGEAIDVSVSGMTPERIREVYTWLRRLLGPAFTVLLEAPVDLLAPSLTDILYRNPKATGIHLHLQRKKGTIYPPPEITPVKSMLA